MAGVLVWGDFGGALVAAQAHFRGMQFGVLGAFLRWGCCLSRSSGLEVLVCAGVQALAWFFAIWSLCWCNSFLKLSVLTCRLEVTWRNMLNCRDPTVLERFPLKTGKA